MNPQAGNVVLLRDIYQERIWSARPGRKIGNFEGQELIYFPLGTICQWPCDDDGTNLRVPKKYWILKAGPWMETSHLHFVGAQSIWTASIHWSETGEFAGWKVDFHAPWKTSRFGFDSLDWAIDLMIRPDRTWYLKDEQEFATYQELGVLNSEEASALMRALYEDVIPDIEARRGPFQTKWKNWIPPSNMKPAALTNDWQEP